MHFFPGRLAYKTLGRSITLSTQNSPFQCKTPSDFLSNSWALSVLRSGLLWARNRHRKWPLQFLLSYPNSHPHSTLQTQHLTPLHLESNTGPSADCLSWENPGLTLRTSSRILFEIPPRAAPWLGRCCHSPVVYNALPLFKWRKGRLQVILKLPTEHALPIHEQSWHGWSRVKKTTFQN